MILFDRRFLLGAGAASFGLLLAGVGPAAAQRRFAVTRTEAEWRRLLSADAFSVLRGHGTERAGSSPLDRERRRGIFHCAGCNHPLFSSTAKFDSGTGWPSFFRVLAGAVGTREDRGQGMRRTEVHCARCGGHLGHLFRDGPRPTGLRYCMNGVAMRFRPG